MAGHVTRKVYTNRTLAGQRNSVWFNGTVQAAAWDNVCKCFEFQECWFYFKRKLFSALWLNDLLQFVCFSVGERCVVVPAQFAEGITKLFCVCRKGSGILQHCDIFLIYKTPHCHHHIFNIKLFFMTSFQNIHALEYENKCTKWCQKKIKQNVEQPYLIFFFFYLHRFLINTTLLHRDP